MEYFWTNNVGAHPIFNASESTFWNWIDHKIFKVLSESHERSYEDVTFVFRSKLSWKRCDSGVVYHRTSCAEYLWGSIFSWSVQVFPQADHACSIYSQFADAKNLQFMRVVSILFRDHLSIIFWRPNLIENVQFATFSFRSSNSISDHCRNVPGIIFRLQIWYLIQSWTALQLKRWRFLIFLKS